MIYLASPYSHPDPEIREARYLKTVAETARLASLRHVVYSPIVHWHVVAKYHTLPYEASFWEHQNRSMLKLATTLYILTLDGWEESTGVTQELIWAKQLSIPVLHS